MSRRVNRVRCQLDPKDVKDLPLEEVKAILRGADDLIMTGGRNLLAKILKGSKDKKLLEHKLDENPVYGYYSELTISQITARIDWMILNSYLKLEYDHRLPLLVYTEEGWEIERDTYALELLTKLMGVLESGDYSFVSELKDRNRGMILLLLEKIKDTKDQRFIPLLEHWSQIEYKKVQKAIRSVIRSLEGETN